MTRSLSFPFLFIFILLLLQIPRAICQDFPMQHYTVEDGLPSNTVYEIYRDSKGFLWFATDKGVARYNGIKFETFTTFNGLPDNEVFFFQEDYYGRLWLGTYNGELCYYKDDTFHTAANTPFLKLPFKAPFVKMISIETDSSVTICFSEQFKFLNIGKDKYHIYNLDIKSVSTRGVATLNQILYVKKQPENVFEIILQDRVVRINEASKVIYMSEPFKKGIIERFPCQNKEYFFMDNYIFSDSNIIFTFNKYHLKVNEFNRAYLNEKNVFIATNDGLIINDSFKILKGYKVSSITQDNVGNYWISTLNAGAYIMPFFNAELFNAAYNNKVKYCSVINSRLFYTTSDNNLYTINNNNDLKCLYYFQKNNAYKYKYPDEPGYLLNSNYKYYMFYNNEHLVIENIFANPKVIRHYANNFVFDGIKFVSELDGCIFMQNRRRLVKIDYKKLKEGNEINNIFRVFTDTTVNNRIYCTAKAADNSIWYSTINNIYRIKNDREELQSQFAAIKFKSFNFYGKRMIGYTHNNLLLICSDYDKIVKIDTIPPQNCIWDKLYQLDSSHILISTNNLYRLLTLYPTSAKEKYMISAIENPFIPLQAEAICADSNNCYFFKNGSITSIGIKSILVKPVSPKLFLKSLKAGAKYYRLDNDIQIPFAEARNITIKFSTLSFGGKDVSYQYSISKNDEDNWRDITGDINLANISYGNYTVKIKAKTISSDYSTPYTFNLTILRPYWATWWFVALCIIALTAIVTVIIRRRIRYVLRKNEKEHLSEIRFMKSEYKALNALMNPHFIFNTLNNVQALVNRNDKLAANEYLRVFADLIRQNMHNVSKELISLEKEMSLVTNYLILEKLRFENNLNYIIDIDPDLDLSDIMVPPLLIQPLVENSIKHGIFPLESVDGTIHIRLYQQGGILYIEVRDNGVGMGNLQNRKDMEHESFGLENIRKRIAQLSIIQNKEITFNISDVRDSIGKLQWTVVTISMPVSV